MSCLKWYMPSVGAMDMVTGLLLVFAPNLTLSFMGIAPPPDQAIFLRWIGVFVFAVGSAYLLPFLESGRTRRRAHRKAGRRARQKARRLGQVLVLKFTGLARLAVGLFVTYAIVSGQLPRAWASVAITDLTCGIFQFIYLRREAFHDANRTI